jgi:DNA-binding Xre family transcriptional regulator
MSGTELSQRLFLEIRPDEEASAPVISTAGRSPEYWGGWALAHFQWYWCKTFRWILARTSMSNLLGKYSVYHEMEVSRFLEDFMQELESVKVEKNLRRMRLAAGYSQSELSRLSGVNIRNIQLYEQGVQDINRASASTLASLARPLACTIEDLME